VGLASDLAYEALLKDILAGTIPIGDRIREEEVAARVGVSRTPVREALRRLHAEGLVDVLPHKGAVVQAAMYEIEEVQEVRALLEGYGAERAALRRTDEDLAVLSDLCDRMEAVVAEDSEMSELTTLNMAFHRRVQSAAGVERLIGMIPALMVSPLVRETFRHYTPRELARSMAHHREIVEAITVGDPAWARSVMCAHLYAGRVVLSRVQQEAATAARERGTVESPPESPSETPTAVEP
jgi:DNA-binding GntR family transcriptional regulator